MRARAFAVLSGFTAMVVVAAAATARADSLSGQLDGLFGQQGITLDVRPINPQFPPHTAHFQSASLQQLGVLTSELSAEAADFPAISTVPGLTYVYNEKLQVFEPVAGALGPIYVERPETLGEGRIEVGLAYAYIDFSKLNGDDLEGLNFTLRHNDCCGGPNTPDFPAFEDDSIDVRFDEFKLRSHVFSVTGTYGLTPRWDVNLLLPVVFTELKVRGVATINNTTDPPIHFFDNDARTTQTERKIDDDRLGVGDLQLRTKYRLGELVGMNSAVGLTFRFPTGSQDDFQGFGDFTLEPFLVMARDLGPINLHASGGLQIDPETIDRTRVRYAGGAAWQATEKIALIADVIGSSNIENQEDSIDVPEFDQQGNVTAVRSVPTRVHADIVDIAPGIKVNLAGTAVAFFTAFVPLNDSGLRADFIPTGGIEMSF
jgi:hypothetical protein